MMNLEVKQKWITALRSGEFEQGRRSLCEVDGEVRAYCCLGVLCEVAIASGLALKTQEYGGIRSYDGSTATLPGRVEKWAGVAESRLTSGAGLAALNDCHGKSFNEIADLIEEEDVV